MSTVTAIIPTYNRSEFIQDALLSVTSQTHRVNEIIVVDDGSTDETENIVHNFRRSCPIDIRYLYQENRGPATARNHGIQLAESKYIAFLDSDDLWHKSKIEKQLAGFRKCKRYLISHTGEKWFRRGKHLNQKKKHLPRCGNIFIQSLQLCAVGMSTVMVDRDLFSHYGLFDEQLQCCEDYDFWLRVSSHQPILLIDEPLTVKHGGREDQVSSIYSVGMDTFRIYALEKLLKQEKLPLSGHEKEQLKRVFKTKCEIYANGCVKHNKIQEAEQFFQKIIQFNL